MTNETAVNLPAGIDKDLYERVLSTIAKHRKRKKKDICPEARILQDLGCDGMDAHELLTAFRAEFDIDFFGFDFDRHFGSEGCNPVEILECVFEPNKRKKIPITVMDLYDAARTKKFPDLSNRAVE